MLTSVFENHYSFNLKWAEIVAGFDNAIAEKFEYAQGEENVYFQYIKRDISKELTSLEKGTYFDIITPFDYGAFYYTSEEALKKALELFVKKCQEENIISGFFRFNPMIGQNYEILNQYIDIIALQKHIVIALNEAYPKNFSKRKIRNIKKARKYSHTFIADDNVDNFYCVYIETMKRVESSQYFKFSQEALEKLSSFGKVFSIQYDNQVVSSIFVIEDKETIFYFLGGTLKKYITLGFNSLLFDYVCQHYLGKKKFFFLGGGHDGLYRFKEEFSHETRPFYIGKAIFNAEVYDQLTQQINRKNNDFFPQYREKTI